MDTMTYAAFAAFRGDVAEKSNQPRVYYPEKELMEVQHYLQAIFADHRKTSLSNLIHPHLLLRLHHHPHQRFQIQSDGHHKLSEPAAPNPRARTETLGSLPGVR